MNNFRETRVDVDRPGANLAIERDSDLRQANMLILESVDETLGDLLGGRIREVVYDCLEKNRSITRDEIPMNLSHVFSTLEGVLGKEVGKMITTELSVKLNKKSTDPLNAECSDYLDQARGQLNK